MSDDDETPMLICVSVKEAVATAEGSEVRWCHICADEVWVSPSGLEFIAEEGVLPVCVECVAGLPRGPVEMAPGALQHMREVGVPDAEISQTIAYAKADIARRRAARGSPPVGPDHRRE